MGRIDLRPRKVHESASLLLEVTKQQRSPAWYKPIADYPPTESLVRTQPVPHRSTTSTPSQYTRSKRYRKPSKMFQPMSMRYEEDRLRQEFFSDHPWELARPRTVLEDDGKEYQKWNWGKSYETGRPVNGESVIKRQRWLMLNKFGKTVTRPDGKSQLDESGQPVKIASGEREAYDEARKEFYEVRHQDEIESRVAKEEALATGAYFGKSTLDVGMHLENKVFEQWKDWAVEQVTRMEQTRSSAYTGAPSADEARPDDGDVADSLESAVDQIGDRSSADDSPQASKRKTTPSPSPF